MVWRGARWKSIGCWIACLLLLTTSVSRAQDRARDIAGTWQGMLDGSRIVFQVSREGDGRLTVARYNLDHGGWESPSVAFSSSLDSAVLRASFNRGDFTGTLARDGRSIVGSWVTASGGAPAPAQRMTFSRPTAATAWRDTVSHRVRFVAVEPHVRLEVLDFGGTGRPLVMLAGLGDNAHTFDVLAPKLTDHYHVYAITRRGFAPSSVPTSGYLSDSLADDVLAVLDSLHLERPVLAGHSIAGQELSSIGSRRPERVAGLVYLDAANVYAYYDPTVEDNAPYIIPDVQRRLALVFDRWAPISFAERGAMVRELADATLPVLIRDLRLWADDLATAPNPTVRPKGLRRDPVAAAIFAGGQRYTRITGPVLAITVAPGAYRGSATDSATRAKSDSLSLGYRMPQINAFRRGVPQAHVVLLPHADHYVWRSNEADVLREMRAFIDRTAHAQQPAVRITADPRIELMAIVFRLGGAGFDQTSYVQYDSAIRRHFEPFRAHEAVTLARELHDKHDVGFSTVMSLAIAFGPLPGLELRVNPDSVLGRRVPGPEMARFAAAYQRFATDSRAEKFFAEQQSRLDSAAAHLARPVTKANAFEWVAHFFGVPADRDFVVAPLLANSQGNYGVCVRPTRGQGSGRLECWQIIGHTRTDSAGFATWGDDMVATLVHEISHSYANPLADARGAQFEPALTRTQQAFAAQMAAQAYTSWRPVLYESLVRATVARFIAERGTPEQFREYLADERGQGWLWLPELVDLYAEYDAERAGYPTLESFMPRVVAYFDSLPDRIPALKQAYDAGRPHVVSSSLPTGDTAVVTADVREIIVRFDRPVRPHRFAVVPLFVDGRPLSTQVPPPPVTAVTLDSSGMTARLAVTLEPGHAYAFQLNTPHGFGFRTAEGVPLAPVVIRLRVEGR